MIRFVKKVKKGKRIESDGVRGVCQIGWAGEVFLRRWHLKEGQQIRVKTASAYMVPTLC